MIPDHILDTTFDSVTSILGKNVIFNVEGKRVATLGILEKNPVTVDIDGNEVVSEEPKLTLKHSYLLSEFLEPDTLCIIDKDRFRIRNIFKDKTRRKIYCELKKDKN